jgi:hypothetical protein
VVRAVLSLSLISLSFQEREGGAQRREGEVDRSDPVNLTLPTPSARAPSLSWKERE